MRRFGKDMKKPTIGLALGAGGVKGLAHIGVLKALKESGIEIDLIAGTSMGAIVGGCYAAGVPLENLEQMTKKVRQSQLIDWGFLARKHGFVKGNRAQKLIEKVLETNGAAKTFKSCKIPFACLSTDLLTGKAVVVKSGNLAKGIRASFSIAGVFRPVRKDKMLLVDGGTLSRVPVRLAREMGADIVIGVDVVGKTGKIEVEELDSLTSTIIRVFYIMDYEISKNEISEADYQIEINQPEVNSLKIKYATIAVTNGYEKMKKEIKKIKETLESWQKHKNKLK